MNAASVSDLDEREAVELLLTGLHSRFFAEPLGVSVWEPRFSVPRDELALPGIPGDVDALLVSNGDCERTTAIECKRVKFQAHAVVSDGDLPNKLNQLAKAVRQTNGLISMGFHRVFLLVIVQVDARLQQTVNWFGKGLRAGQATLVERSVPFGELDPGAGAMIVEIMQPVDKEIHLAGGIGFPFSRLAVPRPQSPDLAAKIRRYFEKTRT